MQENHSKPKKDPVDEEVDSPKDSNLIIEGKSTNPKNKNLPPETQSFSKKSVLKEEPSKVEPSKASPDVGPTLSRFFVDTAKEVISKKGATKEELKDLFTATQAEQMRLIGLRNELTMFGDEETDAVKLSKAEASLNTIDLIFQKIKEKVASAPDSPEGGVLPQVQEAVIASLKTNEKLRGKPEGSYTNNTNLVEKMIEVTTQQLADIDDLTPSMIRLAANFAFTTIASGISTETQISSKKREKSKIDDEDEDEEKPSKKKTKERDTSDEATRRRRKTLFVDGGVMDKSPLFRDMFVDWAKQKLKLKSGELDSSSPNLEDDETVKEEKGYLKELGIFTKKDSDEYKKMLSDRNALSNLIGLAREIRLSSGEETDGVMDRFVALPPEILTLVAGPDTKVKAANRKSTEYKALVEMIEGKEETCERLGDIIYRVFSDFFEKNDLEPKNEPVFKEAKRLAKRLVKMGFDLENKKDLRALQQYLSGGPKHNTGAEFLEEKFGGFSKFEQKIDEIVEDNDFSLAEEALLKFYIIPALRSLQQIGAEDEFDL